MQFNTLVLIAASVAAMVVYPAACVTMYVPMMEPVSYSEGEQVDIRVNALRSLSEIMPFEYYKLPFCKPDPLLSKPEVLGEVIWGDKVQTSSYHGQMNKNVKCQLVPGCDFEANSKEVLKNIDTVESFINKGYRGHMSIDNLPAWHNGTMIFNGNCKGVIPEEQTFVHQRGYALGVNKGCTGKALINNHLEMRIEVNRVEGSNPPQFRVVGFTITPHSVKHQNDGGDCKDNSLFDPTSGDIVPLTTDDVRAGANVMWSYGITWTENPDVKWATRWDSYLKTSLADTANSIHWWYIVISIVLTISLALIAAIILLRTLNRDFMRYNNPTEDELQEEIGWKLVHADVFRPPTRAALLAALVGNGAQLLAMFCGTMVLAFLGFLSPSARGILLTCIILLYVFMSFVGGYTCGRLLKYFDVQEWKHVFVCAFLFPGTVTFFYFVSDVINAVHHASDSVPFLTLVTIFCLWLLIAVPLTVLGASLAFHQLPITNPVNIGKLAREIPTQRVYLTTSFLIFTCAIPPLLAIFTELKFILSSLWQGMVYYVFGFLCIVFVVWAIIVALTSIIMVYYMLCYENHQWWWTAFAAPGGLGLHLFAYSVYYYHTQLDISAGAATMLYFIYMGLLSLAYGIAAGCIGVASSMMFTRKIYGAIKID